MNVQRSAKVSRRPVDDVIEANVEESTPVLYVTYDGQEWAVPINYKAPNITHGVFGKHMYRGAINLRWRKAGVSFESLIYAVRELYGMAVSDIEFIEIDPPAVASIA